MTRLPNREDTPEFQKRWAKEWEENESKLRGILPNPDQIELTFIIRFLSRKPILWVGALASAHLMLLSAFGFWFIPISSNVLRARSKSIYIFSSLPGINIYIWLLIWLIKRVRYTIFLFLLTIVFYITGYSHPPANDTPPPSDTLL